MANQEERSRDQAECAIGADLLEFRKRLNVTTFGRALSLSKRQECLRRHEVFGEDLGCWSGDQISRLNRVMTGDDISNKVTFETEFELFCDLHPSWRGEDCVLFWKSYPDLKDLMVIRQQHSGLCFMHAPVALQHYLVSINSGTSDRKMIDIARFIDLFRMGDSFLQIVKYDLGGDSAEFLEEIFVDDPSFETMQTSINCTARYWAEQAQDLSDMLKVRPALVSHFWVDETFRASGTTFLHPKDFEKTKKIGRHAMLLIGSRVEGRETIFLLQNWWKGRYLIEVSASYLSKCGALIIDVKESSLESIPSRFPVVESLYAETSIDCQETFHERTSLV
jgi:hypothetical protein